MKTFLLIESCKQYQQRRLIDRIEHSCSLTTEADLTASILASHELILIDAQISTLRRVNNLLARLYDPNAHGKLVVFNATDDLLATIQPHLHLYYDVIAKTTSENLLDVRLDKLLNNLDNCLVLQFDAMVDDLTGLYNRKHIETLLSSQYHTMQRSHTDLTLGFFDIDHFKEINDTHGHYVGDIVLRKVAQILKRIFKRDSDFIGRFGGDEFIVIMGATSISMARSLIDLFYKELKTSMICLDKEYSFSIHISSGLAQCHQDERMTDWMVRCDRNLYKAKSLGRNQCHDLIRHNSSEICNLSFAAENG